MGADCPSWSLVWLLFRIGILVVVTPAKGVTWPWRRWAPASGNFNSHPREGGDKLETNGVTLLYISILTPVKGVTELLPVK